MEDMLSYLVKLTTGLIGVMVVLRLLGNKELAQITPLDFVYALILGSIVEESIYETDVPFYEMLIIMAYWGLLIFIIERLAMNSDRFRKITKGSAQLLIDDGVIDKKVLNRHNMDVDELRELLRLKDVFSLREVKYAVMEPSGQLSVIKYAAAEPPSRGEVLKDYRKNSLSYLFIDNGKVELSALKAAGVDLKWLEENLEKETEYKIEDIFLAEWNGDQGFFIQPKG